MRKLVCSICGKTFVVRGRGRNHTTCERCRKELKTASYLISGQKPQGAKSKEQMEWYEAIQVINRPAYEEGLSYGQYVIKYGL